VRDPCGKTDLQPGETKTAELTLTRDSFAFYNLVQQSWVTEAGKFHILLGRSSGDIRLTTKFTWKGDPKLESEFNTQRNICLPLGLLLEDSQSTPISEKHIGECIKYDYRAQILSMSLEQLSLHQARCQASLQSVLARIIGRRSDLLSYDDVRKQLQATQSADRQHTDIALNAIIGSANRNTDFTRDFLPKRSIDTEHWARVKAAALGAGRYRWRKQKHSWGLD